MVVDLNLGGHVVKALIDTGASRSYVNAELPGGEKKLKRKAGQPVGDEDSWESGDFDRD